MDILTFKTVLVAEDDDFMRRVLVAVLTRLGGRVIESADGIEALKILNEPSKIDLALLDILMPNAHGLYVLHAIRAGQTNQDFEMPVMLLTATRDEASVQIAAGLHCDGFVVKPVNQTDLAERLSKVFTKRMTLPYKPTHYRKIDVGSPELPPGTEASRKSGLKIDDLRVGMVFRAPVVARNRTIVPPNTPVTPELLALLRDLEKVMLIDPMTVETTGSLV